MNALATPSSYLGKKLFLLITLCTVGISFLGCPSNDNTMDDPFGTFDRRAMLENIASNVIAPSFDEFSNKAVALDNAAGAFIASPSSSTLTAAQQAWLDVGLAWKAVEFYRIGPLDNNSTLLASIDSGSLDPSYRSVPADSVGIRNTLQAASTVDKAFVESLRPSYQGIPVLEYLLFSRNSDEEILARFTTDADAAKYRSYLKTLTTSLTSRAATLQAGWAIGTGTIHEEFVEADGRDIGSSLSMLVNDFSFLLDATHSEKLGRPLGLRNNGVKQPTRVEAYLSKQSVPFMLKNIEALQTMFQGGASATGNGLDDLLDHMGAKYGDVKLSEMIAGQFAKVKEAMQAMPSPLDQTAATNPELLQATYTEAKKLLVLVKVDMTNNLGVMITYQDNDGD